MTGLDELLHPPGERDLPAASFARLRSELVGVVEDDLRRGATRRARVLGLRGWLMLIGLVVLLASLAGSASAHLRLSHAPALAAVAGGAGTVVLGVSASRGLPRAAQLQYRAGTPLALGSG